MLSKSFRFLSAVCTSLSLSLMHAQSGGGSGAGGGGSAGTSSGSSSSAAASSTSTAGGSSAPTTGIPTSAAPANGSGAVNPNMAPSTPSRSALDTGATATAPNAARSDNQPLPAGLSVATPQPGVSSLSGLPTSEIPHTSAGTRPIGADPSAAAASQGTTVANAAQTPAVEPRNRASTTLQSVPGDPASQTRPQTGIADGFSTVVSTPPPAPVPEPMSPTSNVNSAGQVWVAGRYSWVAGQWSWVAGTWERPPNSNSLWVPGSYDSQSKRWTEGHW